MIIFQFPHKSKVYSYVATHIYIVCEQNPYISSDCGKMSLVWSIYEVNKIPKRMANAQRN